MGKKRQLQNILLLIPAMALALSLYQNCNSSALNPISSAKTSSQSENKPSSSPLTLSAGGEGYEGKVYVELENELCPDGSKVKSRIRFDSEKAIMLREDCTDLVTEKAIHPSSLENLSLSSFSVKSSTFFLESVGPRSSGVPTPGLVTGDFAPSVNRMDFGKASAIQAAPLDKDHVLVIIGNGPNRFMIDEVDYVLVKKTGMNLEVLSKTSLEISGVEEGFHIDPLSNLSVLSPDRAILFVRSTKNGQSGFKTHKIERIGNSLQVAEGAFIDSDNTNLSGHPIDENRLLLSYTSNSVINYRVQSFNSSPELGPIMIAPAQYTTPSTGAPNHPAILKTSDANEFVVFKANAGLGASELSKFIIRVDDTQLDARDYTVLDGFGINSASPLALGSFQKGIFFYQAAVPQMTDFYHWATINDGLVTYRDPVQIGNLRGEWPGVTSMLRSDNLQLGENFYVRLPSLSDDRIRSFSTDSNTSLQFNLYLIKNSWRGGTGRLFAAGDKLLFVDLYGGSAQLIVVSTLPTSQ